MNSPHVLFDTPPPAKLIAVRFAAGSKPPHLVPLLSNTTAGKLLENLGYHQRDFTLYRDAPYIVFSPGDFVYPNVEERDELLIRSQMDAGLL